MNQWMKWYLETNNLLAHQQARFRQFRSTEDQEKATCVTWIDLQKAFDKVWTDGPQVKLQRNGIESKMYT